MPIERARKLRKNMPPMEAKLWNALRELKALGFHFRRQVPVGRYYADFAAHAQRLIVEVDGETHFGGTGPAYDSTPDDFIRGEGYSILRVTNHDVAQHLDGVMALVLARLEAPEHSATPTLNPSPQGGGRRRSQISATDLPPPCGEGSVARSEAT